MYYNDLLDAVKAVEATFDEVNAMCNDNYPAPKFPLCDVDKSLKDGTLTLTLALAGYKKDVISISTEENCVVVKTVEGYETPKVAEGTKRMADNIKKSPFVARYILPETKFNFAEITAKFEDGELVITIPPKEKKEYKSISIA